MPVTKSQNTKEIYRAAVYARVSTLQEEQEDSFENQKEYYSTLINLQNNLILTEVYGDRYSGTSDKREGFLNMGSNTFKLAGSVLLYGIVFAIILTLVKVVLNG